MEGDQLGLPARTRRSNINPFTAPRCIRTWSRLPHRNDMTAQASTLARCCHVRASGRRGLGNYPCRSFLWDALFATHSSSSRFATAWETTTARWSHRESMPGTICDRVEVYPTELRRHGLFAKRRSPVGVDLASDPAQPYSCRRSPLRRSPAPRQTIPLPLLDWLGESHPAGGPTRGATSRRIRRRRLSQHLSPRPL